MSQSYKSILSTNPRPVCRSGKHLMSLENVWIKPSTGQRYCKACRKETRDTKRECNKGYFELDQMWPRDVLAIATQDQLRNYKLALNIQLENAKTRLKALEDQNAIVVEEIIKRSDDNYIHPSEQ
jgi:hypothetical protein